MKIKPKKIFQYEPTNNYSWGCILIAALSKEEADKIMKKGKESGYLNFEFIEEVKKLKYFGKAGIILDNAGCE